MVMTFYPTRPLTFIAGRAPHHSLANQKTPLPAVVTDAVTPL